MNTSTATDFADDLVRVGLPVRNAHHMVAAILGEARNLSGTSLADVSRADLRGLSEAIDQDVQSVLTVEEVRALLS